MDDREIHQLEVAADRAERARLDAELEAALVRHGLVVQPSRPGFAARRDRRLIPSRTREG